MQLERNQNYHSRILTIIATITVSAIALALYTDQLCQGGTFWCISILVVVAQKSTSRIIADSTGVTIHYYQWVSERQIFIPLQKAKAVIKKMVEFRVGNTGSYKYLITTLRHTR